MKNYITQERNNKIPNLEVLHLAVNNHGDWLVTFEADCPSNSVLADYKLKFWQFKHEEQRFLFLLYIFVFGI